MDDMISNTIPIKKQIKLIWLSKKNNDYDCEELAKATGLYPNDVRYIISQQRTILENWRKPAEASNSNLSTHLNNQAVSSVKHTRPVKICIIPQSELQKRSHNVNKQSLNYKEAIPKEAVSTITHRKPQRKCITPQLKQHNPNDPEAIHNLPNETTFIAHETVSTINQQNINSTPEKVNNFRRRAPQHLPIIECQAEQDAMHQLLIEWTKRSLWNTKGKLSATKINRQIIEFQRVFSIPKYQTYPYFWNDYINFQGKVQKKIALERKLHYYLVDNKTVVEMCKNRLKPAMYAKFMAKLSTHNNEEVKSTNTSNAIPTKPINNLMREISNKSPINDMTTRKSTENPVEGNLIKESRNKVILKKPRKNRKKKRTSSEKSTKNRAKEIPTKERKKCTPIWTTTQESPIKKTKKMLAIRQDSTKYRRKCPIIKNKTGPSNARIIKITIIDKSQKCSKSRPQSCCSKNNNSNNRKTKDADSLIERDDSSSDAESDVVLIEKPVECIDVTVETFNRECSNENSLLKTKKIKTECNVDNEVDSSCHNQILATKDLNESENSFGAMDKNYGMSNSCENFEQTTRDQLSAEESLEMEDIQIKSEKDDVRFTDESEITDKPTTPDPIDGEENEFITLSEAGELNSVKEKNMDPPINSFTNMKEENETANSSSQYSCEKCCNIFESFDEMQSHFSENLCGHKMRIFQCYSCLNNIFGFKNFMKHLTECENNESDELIVDWKEEQEN